MDNKTIAIYIRVFGACLALAVVTALIWSLTQPPVTEGPEPPEPAPLFH
jgi:hypothetical protein